MDSSMIRNIFEEAKKSRKYAAAIGLYILTCVLGVIAYLAARRIVLSTHTRIFPINPLSGTGSINFVNIITSMVLVFPLIAIIIGGFEYHHRRVGEAGSWRFFARTLAGELAILLLALFI